MHCSYGASIGSSGQPGADLTTIHLADNTAISLTETGQCALPIVGTAAHQVLRVQKLHEPLLSVARLVDNNLKLVFSSISCDILHAVTGSLVGSGERRGNLFYLKGTSEASLSLSNPSQRSLSSNAGVPSLLVWHRRLGHLGLASLKHQMKTWGISRGPGGGERGCSVSSLLPVKA